MSRTVTSGLSVSMPASAAALALAKALALALASTVCILHIAHVYDSILHFVNFEFSIFQIRIQKLRVYTERENSQEIPPQNTQLTFLDCKNSNLDFCIILK